MKKTLDIIKTTRQNFLKLIDNLTIEELNTIPSGFNNNIVWHLGHLVCSQQRLCYQLSHVEFKVPIDSVAKYGKDTKPESFISAEEIALLKQYLISTTDDLISDYSNSFFGNYTPYETSYRVKLTSIDEAIQFVAVHEGVHFGYAMALKRSLLDKVEL